MCICISKWKKKYTIYARNVIEKHLTDGTKNYKKWLKMQLNENRWYKHPGHECWIITADIRR